MDLFPIPHLYGLYLGPNSYDVTATDGSNLANQTTDTISLTYIPFVVDTDGDGLDDNFELAIGTDPALADTDSDGITDGDELGYDGVGGYFDTLTDTDPLSADTDGDGVNDGAEVAAGTDPLDGDSFPAGGDLNNDGAVDAADILLAEQILSGAVDLTQEHLDRGDVAPLVNGVPTPDGVFDAADVLIIQRKALGLIVF